jgi:molecular chaperone DnaK
LDEKEVERMRAEAERHKTEDEDKKVKIEARNQADSLIFTAEKTIKDAGDKAPEDLKKEVEDKVKNLKEILDTGTKEDLESKSKDLMDSLQKLGGSMYQQSQTPPQDDQAQKAGDDNKDKDSPEEGEVVN